MDSNEDLGWTQALPFDEKKQNAILGHLLSNRQFFMQGKDIIQPSWFLSPHNRKIWATLVGYYRTWKAIPTREELLGSGSIKVEDPKNKAAINARLIQCTSDTLSYRNLEALKGELTQWLHASTFHQKMHDAVGLFNKAHFSKAYDKLNETNKLLQKLTFETDKREDFSNFEADFLAMENEGKNGLTFGLPAIDNLLLPHMEHTGGSGGGLLRGDMTVLLAPTNVGKTTCMITIARHNVLAGKDVLFLTHEGRPADIRQKIWCSILGKTKGEAMAMVKTQRGKQEFQDAYDIFSDNLCYVPYNKPGMTVEEVETIIRRKHDELFARKGKGFDLLIDDYPAKLTTSQNHSGRMQKRNVDEVVYDYFVQLSLELDMHSVTAIQTNRNGSKVNKQQDGADRLLTKEDVSESWGVMTIAANVISINRNEACKRDGRVIFYIDKSRSSETGIAVATQSDYARALTHSPDFNHAWYYGDASPSDKLGDLLTQYNGGCIPQSEVR